MLVCIEIQQHAYGVIVFCLIHMLCCIIIELLFWYDSYVMLYYGVICVLYDLFHSW